ncbi:MAG TPA: di-heme oxidoredictase family protein [Terriglobia bacterium]|nr:di-heme oxidoredictase family protein [Terriglobia bacterium]
MQKFAIVLLLTLLAVVGFFLFRADFSSSVDSSSAARDPGMRGGAAGAGGPIAELTETELAFFNVGKDDFEEEEQVADGLGPTMNLGSCSGCHLQPAVGGTSPRLNPQVAFANMNGVANTVPSFITANGPVREARFVRNPDGTPDGGVHDLFTIAGRADATGCMLAQPDFKKALADRNIIFRIPTPLFGAGLIEQIPDKVILANQASDAPKKESLKIGGRPNIILAGHAISGQGNNNGNDGTVARFGWKAQNKSLLLFSGEAYNVEMGITNELFQTERDETATCQFATAPNDVTNTNGQTPVDAISAIEKFAFFARFLAAPTPSPDTPGGAESIARGRNLFDSTGCGLCHTPTLNTGNATVVALRNKPVNLYSDLLVHNMGRGLADGVTQGQAGPREFRTAPLWGLGQRLFFLHDGRTSDLLEAIQAHQSGGRFTGGASEANAVIRNFNGLRENQKQDILNFLRSL